ncbi:MAG TPA: hypothetical protein VIE88_12915, partial [Vicinamibacteria bacterium]
MAFALFESRLPSVALVAGALAFTSATPAERDVDWPLNGGPGNSRYSTLDQIDRGNVSRLEVAWIYDSHDAFQGSEMQSNPVVVDGL